MDVGYGQIVGLPPADFMKLKSILELSFIYKQKELMIKINYFNKYQVNIE